MNLQEQYKRLFTGKARSNDVLILNEKDGERFHGPAALKPFSRYKVYDPKAFAPSAEFEQKAGDLSDNNWKLYTIWEAEFGIHNYGGVKDFKNALDGDSYINSDIKQLVKIAKKNAPQSPVTAALVAMTKTAAKGPASQMKAAQALYDEISKDDSFADVNALFKAKEKAGPPITVFDGEVDGRNRTASGTYGDEELEWELTTDDGMTYIFVDGKSIEDDDPMFDAILTAVEDEGYEIDLDEGYLQEQYKRLFKGRMGSNDKKLLKEAYNIRITGKKVDVENAVIGGVERSQGPDDGTTDAYFESADFEDGTPLNDQQLDKLNDEHYDVAVEIAIENFSDY